MKILIIVDKKGSAIHRLAVDQAKYNSHHQIKIISYHPKRPSNEEVNAWVEGYAWADIIDFQYWKTALKILDNFEVTKPTILQHMNPYSINEADWKPLFNEVVVPNKSIQANLPYAKLIYHTIDVAKFAFKRKTPKKFNRVGMVSARIEAKKGVLEVAQACKELGLSLQLVGRVSDPDYFSKIMETGVVDFMQNVDESELVDSYHNIDALIVNSIDNFESGPLPALEAMASGTPVVTRGVGMMIDICNGRNMLMSDGSPKDVKESLAKFYTLTEQEINEKVSAAWETVKHFDTRYRARQYSKLYYKLYSPLDLISIIIPTANREKELADLLISIQAQTYPNIEVVIADDGLPSIEPEYLSKIRELLKFSVKYVSTNKQSPSYNLAYARNLAAAEAEGNYLLFCDDRYVMRPDNVNLFMLHAPGVREWHFGSKGDANKKSFVENFSFIHRRTFVDLGMFNMLINKYGGLTQDTSTRFNSNGVIFSHRPDVICDINRKANSRDSKKADILDMKFLLYKLYNED